MLKGKRVSKEGKGKSCLEEREKGRMLRQKGVLKIEEAWSESGEP